MLESKSPPVFSYIMLNQGKDILIPVMNANLLRPLFRLALGLSLIAAGAPFCFAAAKAAPVARPGENIALGKRYTLTPPPNYKLCTDPGDATQLTDGQYSSGYFWTQKGTVGWNQGSRTVIVRLDLGKVEPIRGVSFNTAAGRAGADWPAEIFILVSDDAKSFHYAGELIELSRQHGTPPPNTYSIHRYWTDALQTRGRYVSLLVNAANYTFVDEVEVYRGEGAWAAAPAQGEAFADERAAFNSLATALGVRRGLRADVDAFRGMLAASKQPSTFFAPLEAELKKIESRIGGLPLNPAPADFRAVLPLNDLHREIFRLQARLWRETMKRDGRPQTPVIAWRGDTWDPLPVIHGYPRTTTATLSVALMRNEYRAAAINFSNSDDMDQTLDIKITGLPGGDNPDWVGVHEVLWTDTATSMPVAAALPPAERHGEFYRVTLTAGLTRQVWLTFHPAAIAPGTYKARVIAKGADSQSAMEIPLTVRVSPLSFPAQPALHLGGWDYTNQDKGRDANPTNREALIAHLREHFVDSPWATSAVLPFGQYDAAGAMTAQPEPAAFDTWLGRWPGARRYCVCLSVGATLGRLKAGTPAFDKAVAEWLRFWTGHAAQRGLKPEQLVLLLLDEPRDAVMDATILAWARAIRTAGSGVQVWEDPIHKDPFAASQAMLGAIDLLCPNRQMCYQYPKYGEYYTQKRPAGTKLEFYSCAGPVRLLDPYSYHRLQAWDCWRHGAQSMYFWAFSDSGGASSWNEYAMAHACYTPLFLDERGVTAGKHMEAIREGVEDYEYLAMLRVAVAEAEKAGRGGAALASAKTLLDHAAERVCTAKDVAQWHWSAPKDRAVADRVRVEILDALEGLK